MGDYAGAEALFLEGLVAERALNDPNHVGLAQSLENLAMLLWRLDRNDEAEPLIREAVGIARNTLPADHPFLALTLNDLGSVRQSQGALDEAEALFRESLEIQRNQREKTTELSVALHNMGAFLEARGDPGGAEAHFREALALNTELLGDGHPDQAYQYHWLGMLFLDQSRYEEALEQFQSALAIRAEKLGQSHPLTLTDLAAIGVTHKRNGDEVAAEPILRDAAERLKSAEGESENLVVVLTELIDLLESQGRGAAATSYRQALAELESPASDS